MLYKNKSKNSKPSKQDNVPSDPQSFNYNYGNNVTSSNKNTNKIMNSSQLERYIEYRFI